MKVRPTLLLLPALFATAACDLKPSVEDGTGMAQELQCSSALTYGGCVRGSATKDQHGYHTALLRRGDEIRLRMTRLDGDLNPGLALKSPKYSVAVRHASVAVRDDAVEKTWTVASTGFYTFVAFPWSNRGAGSYQMDLVCEGGPCLAGATLDAEIAGACIGEARDCTLRALGQAQDATAEAVPGMFDQCLHAEAMPPICGTACSAEGSDRFCGLTIDRLRPFAGRGGECLQQIQSCLEDCVPFNTTADAIVDLGAHPDIACWASETRSTCSTFGMGLAGCRDPLGETGEGYAIGSEQWCQATCTAREANAEVCADRCAPQPNADFETPDPEAAEAAE